jgi:hypothetical protein
MRHNEREIIMRFRLTLTAALGAVLVAGSILAAAPAHAAQNTVGVKGGVGADFNVSCTSASTCNEISTGTLDTYFERTGSTASSLGVYYKIINGTAVDGRDFNIPATGEVVIPAGQTVTDMLIPMVYDGLFDASDLSFGIEITGTTTPITISNGSTSSLIEPGNIPSDCSFIWEGGSSLALQCTGRPSTQVWDLQALCTVFPTRSAYGNEVTGEGTSTASCGNTILNGYLNIVS